MGLSTIAIFVAVIIIACKYLVTKLSKSNPNPFAKDERVPIKKKVFDQKQRDVVLKQGFSINKVPENLDAIIVGSGIGGLTTAALMGKSGKKVLVLEQHDQAGGCCHTFIEKGYEFDVGIHYIGDMLHESMTKTLLDQISDGQIEWEPLDEVFDQVVFKEPGKDVRIYDMNSNIEVRKEHLKKHFPGEEKAIDKFIDLCYEAETSHRSSMIVKFIPLWLVKILDALNIISLITNYWKLNSKTVKQVVEELTDNQELQDVMCYCFGDYGTEPSRAGFPMQATLITHFLKGRAGYPVAGASEIAFNIIPVIERYGGKVLVRAEVEEIIIKDGSAQGVRVKHGTNSYEIHAPLVVSNAGAMKTVTKLLPKEISQKSQLHSVFRKVPQGVGAMSVFVGLDASASEMEISKGKNMWIFTSNDIDKAFVEYNKLSSDEVEDKDVPLLFLSFPSTKDPTFEERYPGKTTVAIITLANFSWFSDWSKEKCKHRSDDYEARKKTIGAKMIDHMCDLYPKTRDHIDYVNIGSPLTNNYYLGANSGEIYGLDHSQERFDVLNCAMLRPKTDIPGLFLTGQDVCSGGFVGGLYGGLLCAQQILGRNIMGDLAQIYKSLKKAE